ncbi:TBC1 domain family member 25 [Merluccius polli]|uniref:TBC1 domain family member 25 n=1 Tax=Merluccius polli TaxID=89951 RepID=A0AA47MG14_MERPO|nr:TBC1 domain family member 25 [Merluccius polli]
MEGEEERGVVRVKVKKCDGGLPAEFRSFAVDPQITSLEVLQHILIRAFDLNGKQNFGISFLSRDRSGGEIYQSLLSDWDLDAAFASAAKPYLQLKIDIKPSEDSPVMEEWDIISPKDVIGSELIGDKARSFAATALPFTQSLLSVVADEVPHPVGHLFYQPLSAALTQMGRTLSRVQQALSWSYGEEVKPFKPPLSDAEFHCYLNSQGQLTRPEELRLRIYHGGVEPSLRKVVWRYLLNVYPDGLSGQERMDYMKRKTREYDQLKGEWGARVSREELDFIRGNVLKDVLRTDRTHPYYAGSEDSPHLTALTDLLTTFAITHPQISYCQGMSDIASPILAVMDNEAHAFICFCGIMKRLEGNFRPDGQLMSVKFQHLKLLLQYSDPEFYAYLVSRGADDLFFCYRWLLLELKREFAFDDALRMLEVTWSSLPPDPPETEAELVGPPLEPEEADAAAASLGSPHPDPVAPNVGLMDEEDRQKAGQRRRHMLRPSREEPDGGQMGFVEGNHGTCQGGVTEGGGGGGLVTMGDNGTPPAPPFEKQLSFGEFEYYCARKRDSFDMEGASMVVDRPLDPATSGPAPCPPSRQSTLDSEDDPGERSPLIQSRDLRSSLDTDAKTSNKRTVSSHQPVPNGLSNWKMSGAAPASYSSPPGRAGSSPDSPPSKYTCSAAADSRVSSQRTLTSPAGAAPSPTAATVKSSISSPSSHPPSRSLLSSPILSFARGPSLPGGKPLLGNLPSPGSQSPGANTPTSCRGAGPAPAPAPKPCSLPPPQEFGKGNPFMLFLCLSILLEHRDHIVKNSLDYNELAMHFDRLVRRHNLGRVLQRAKALFADYLQSEVWDSEEGDEASTDSPVTASVDPLHSPSSPSSSSAPPSSSSTRPIFSPLASPSMSSPNSTYNLSTTIPSPTSQASPLPSS